MSGEKPVSRFLKRLLLLLATLVSLPLFAADSAPESHGLLLAAKTVGPAIVAVGERGHILRSIDSGRTWTIQSSPVEATLTGLSFANDKNGWAVGHDGVILHTTDGGVSWISQYNDKSLSFLDVLAIDAQHAIAVGSFGTCHVTEDGGASWQPKKLSDQDTHYNRIVALKPGTALVAGERGTLLRLATDTFTTTPVPSDYEGSFFGVLVLREGSLLVHGLRGRVYRSKNAEIAWQQIPLERPSLVQASVELKSGVIVLAGQARAFFVSLDHGKTFHAWNPNVTTAIADLLEASDGSILAFGEAGLTHLPKPE